jgi:hypothetical protein
VRGKGVEAAGRFPLDIGTRLSIALAFVAVVGLIRSRLADGSAKRT